MFIGHTDQSWHSVGGDYVKRKYQVVGIFGAVLEAGCHQY